MQNKKIKKFGMEGTIIDDAAIPRMRQKYEGTILNAMRDSGYVPVLDLDPLFYISYDESNNRFNFEIYLHGVYVGKKRATEYDGYAGQRLIPRSNP
ncbi:MAG: hypothetical protein EBU08_03830 [Micrococcales bacterium]|jgi:hypothetical protein|nr:hypothetical protein [Micrococcales bacterium]